MFVLLTLALSAVPLRPASPLVIEAEVAKTSETGRVLRVWASSSTEAVVVTGGLDAAVSADGRRVTVRLSLPERRDGKGRLIVHGPELYGIVHLRQGEVALVHLPGSSELNKAVFDAAAGRADLVVEYQIADGWVKRLGVTGGKVQCEATVSK